MNRDLSTQLGRLSRRWELEMQQNQLNRQGSGDICMTCLRSLQGCQSTRALQVTRGLIWGSRRPGYPRNTTRYILCMQASTKTDTLTTNPIESDHHRRNLRNPENIQCESWLASAYSTFSIDWQTQALCGILMEAQQQRAAEGGEAFNEVELLTESTYHRFLSMVACGWYIGCASRYTTHSTSHSTHYPPPLFLRTWNFWLMKEDMLRQMDRRVKGS